jgi:hypothetical protein
VVKIMSKNKMLTIRSIAAVLAAIIWTAYASRAQEIVCPDTVTVEQKLSPPIEGWKGSVSDTPNRFINVMIYDGPPEQMASLVPTKQGRLGNKEFATWDLRPISKPARESWISCFYDGTNAVLSRPLPKDVTECTVTYNPRQKGGPGYVERISCKIAVPSKTEAPRTAPR